MKTADQVKDTAQATDAASRAQALDPRRSFLVQAPAGSGKTSLLVYRFLSLLAVVPARPQEVIAITFTRKAAHEMKTRVLEVLRRAQDDTPPEQAHEYTGWLLGRRVLMRDDEMGWGILQNPACLCMMTIDSLAAAIVEMRPVMAKLGAMAAVTEDAAALYDHAVQALLGDLGTAAPWADSLSRVLAYFDNQVVTVSRLLASMLPARDQWLPIVMAHQHGDLAQVITQTRDQVARDQLQALCQQLPAGIHATFFEVIAGSFAYLGLPDPTEALQCAGSDVSVWAQVADILLTKPGQLRRSFTQKQGAPAKSSFPAGAERDMAISHKANLVSLAALLSAHGVWLKTLQSVRYLPDCHAPVDDIVGDMLAVLRALVAHLKVLFGEGGEADFTEITLSALSVLRDGRLTADAALILDATVSHILVDEFQDTSVSQFALLASLAQHWSPGDGRTLFCVGDPMQSIYRFRQAEVNLFWQALREGVGPVKLASLVLTQNFRSTDIVVNAINDHCGPLFPERDLPLFSAVPYVPATAMKTGVSGDSFVSWRSVADWQAEADAVVEIVQQTLRDYPTERIAVLVRSRQHLGLVLAGLRRQSVAYHAIEIERLSDTPLVDDLLSLAYAMTHLGDRLSWLALLRSPWCGLSLGEAIVLTEASEGGTIWGALSGCALQSARFSHFYETLSQALLMRGRYPVVDWVMSTWMRLAGAIDPVSGKIADRFFDCLSRAVVDDDIDRPQLVALLSRERLSEAPPGAYVEVMTIHKAKGLEFDTVLLPGLGRQTQSSARALILWQQVLSGVSQSGDPGLLLAPMPGPGDELNTDYQFLQFVSREQAAYEAQRLLYVAMTRAKKRLYCLTVSDDGDQRSDRGCDDG